MVDKNTEKNQGGQQKSEQPRTRSNYYRYNQGQRNHNQNRTQNSAKSPDAQNPGTAQNNHFHSGSKNLNRGSKAHDQQARENGQQPRESGQQRSYYRDRVRDNDKDVQPRQHTAASAGRYGALRNRAEETIDDIKLDIIRLEKEIELEIKEIKSLKL